jgi:signal transduction histidine kinase
MHDAPAWSSPLTAALANCGVGLWWIDSDGVFSADGTLLSMWGLSVEDLERAESEAPVCFVHAEDREAAEAVFARSSQLRVSSERLIRVVRPDGSWRHVLCRRDASDDEHRAAGIAIDLTAVRRAEDTRMRGRAFSTVSTLAARLAHDFNNLLFAILGNATLALGTLQLAGDHPVRESLREIERAGTRASDIVQRLSAFARPVQPRRQMLKVGALVDAAARGLRESLPLRLILVTQLPANEPSVLVDPRLVQELVSNLVSNAVHAMDRRDGAIALEVEPVVLDGQPWMFELGMKPGRYIEVRVRDLGAGMDAATLERCAEPFFSTRPKGGGMGLGLCIAQGVARSHGGGLRIESVLERGTTVQVYFPQ